MPKAYAPYRNNMGLSLMGLSTRRGLGDTTPTVPSAASTPTVPSAASTLQNVAGQMKTTLNKIGVNGSSGPNQNDVGKAAQEVENLSAQVAAYASSSLPLAAQGSTLATTLSSLGLTDVAPFLVEAGPFVIGAAAVVVVAALLIDAFFGSSGPSAGSIYDTNDNLTAQIQTVDSQTQKVINALNVLNSILKQNGVAMNGLSGSTILDATKSIVAAQQATGSLQNQLTQKVTNLQQLVDIFNKTSAQVVALVTKKKQKQDIVLYSFVGLGLIGLGLVTYYATSDEGK